jgi:hypothetical protein
MRLLRVAVAVIMSLFATTIMSYISMAAPIGPWIETTLVLSGMLLFNMRWRTVTAQEYINDLGLTTAAGGIGGILAIAFGFSFPALYFLDAELFNDWLGNPRYFSCVLTSLALAAGSFGIVMATFFQEQLLIKQKMPFPIGELISKTIVAQGQMRKAFELALGFAITILVLWGQAWASFASSCITLLKGFQWSVLTVPTIALPLDQVPMYWAVGFVTGHVIAAPLIVGFLAKFLLLDPLHYVYTHPALGLHKALFSYFADTTITNTEFTVAFCSGMVIYGAFISFLYIPKALQLYIKSRSNSDQNTGYITDYVNQMVRQIPLFEAIISSIAIAFLLCYFKFTPAMQLYLVVGTSVCVYQMMVIAGKIGIAPLGRFATFVMVPGMFLFNLTKTQIIFMATFVEIAGGVACDTLFGRRMALLSSIDRKKVIQYQWLGLIVSSCAVGIIFWLFISHFGLGSHEGALAVNKAVARALLINGKSFDFYVLAMGSIFGYLVTYTRISPMLILGGILMPPYISLMLIVGGLSTYIVKHKEDYYPFWSGVFTANSLWMLVKTFLKTH